MEEIAVSKFKATCLAVIEKIRKTGQPVVITRFGQPVAQIGPPSAARRKPELGWAEGTGEILADIVGPISDESEWEAAQDPTDENEAGRYR